MSMISASVQKQLNQLTPEYRRLIINTFPAFNDSYGRNGMSFFARYFAEYPDYKNIWPNFRGVQDSAIVSSEQLRKHAIKFMHGLKEIVDNLESDERLVETTKKICKKHVTLGVNRMHVEHMVPELLVSLKHCLGPAICEQTELAWKALFTCISTILQTSTA